MTVTLTTNPPYALTGLIPVTVAASVGNFARVWVTNAPEGSTLAKLLVPADSGRVLMPTLTVDGDEVGTVKFDKPGAYTFVVQESTRGANASFGGAYAGDPASFTTEVDEGGEQTVVVYIGARMTLRVGNPTLGFGELVVHVWNDTVRATSVALHKEKTPAMNGGTTVVAEAAVGAAAVATAIDLLPDTTVTSWTSDFVTLFTELRDDIPLHFNNSGAVFHTAADVVNDSAIEDLPDDPKSPEGWARSVSTMATKLRAHLTNDGDSLTGAARYHLPADYENLANLLVPPPSGASMSTVMAALAGCRLVYESHRDDTTYHAIADSTNTIATAAGLLLDVHGAFLAAMSLLLPPSSATQNSGAANLAGLGFVRG